jgi:hypothetical protein
MKKLSWKARRRGNIYCAPACGAGCTWEQHQRVQQQGRHMRQMMRDPQQWRVHVAEHLHWYVCLEHILTNGKLTVWPGWNRYHALLSLDMSHAGDQDWQDTRSFSTPQAAVDHVLKLASSIMAKKLVVMAKLGLKLNNLKGA